MEKIKVSYIILLYIIIFGILHSLKVLSLHTTIFDLGLFENGIWRIAFNGEFKNIAFGHFQPILLFYALIYRIVPSTFTLIWYQTIIIALGGIPLFKLAQLKFGHNHRTRNYPILIVIMYFLYFGVEYNTMFDFHTDHLIIPLIILVFYLLERRALYCQGNVQKSIFYKYDYLILLICFFSLLLKEPIILSVTMLGIYMIIKYRMWKVGLIVTVVSVLFFTLITGWVIPKYTGGENYLRENIAFGYLGNDFLEITKNLFNPFLLVREINNINKVIYLIAIFGSLMFIPVLSPIELLPAFPAIAVSMLSRLQNYYSYENHYTASVIPAVFVAFVFGIKKIDTLRRKIEEKKGKNLTNFTLSHSIKFALLFSVFFNFWISPSPISRFFWLKENIWSYNRSAYIITDRDRIINSAIKRYIPENPDVSICSQNTVNPGYLARRENYYVFPYKMDESDYLVLDLKRPQFIGDKINSAEFQNEFEAVKKSRKCVFSYDGFYIFSRNI